jgi:hypothetical protein
MTEKQFTPTVSKITNNFSPMTLRLALKAAHPWPTTDQVAGGSQ